MFSLIFYFFSLVFILACVRTYVCYVDANETRENKSCNRKIDECALLLLLFFFYFTLLYFILFYFTFCRSYFPSESSLLRLCFYLLLLLVADFDQLPIQFPLYNCPTFRSLPHRQFYFTLRLNNFANHDRDRSTALLYVRSFVRLLTRPISSDRSIRFRDTTHIVVSRRSEKRAV